MEKITYDVDYFIKKFEAIPESLWTIDTYGEGETHCALGHCGMRPGAIQYNREADKLFDLVYNRLSVSITELNDGLNPIYQQPTPKQRILAALYDIKKLNHGTGTSTERRNNVTSELPNDDYKNITPELAKLPIDETSDVRLQSVN